MPSKRNQIGRIPKPTFMLLKRGRKNNWCYQKRVAPALPAIGAPSVSRPGAR